ncbi:hypothetical protein D3C86_1783550 [compost metagenome]
MRQLGFELPPEVIVNGEITGQLVVGVVVDFSQVFAEMLVAGLDSVVQIEAIAHDVEDLITRGHRGIREGGIVVVLHAV